MGQMDPKGDSLVVREVLEGGAAQKQGMLPGTDFVEMDEIRVLATVRMHRVRCTYSLF